MSESVRRPLPLGAVVGLCLLLASHAHADTITAEGDRSGEGSTPFTGLAQAPEANQFTGALQTSVAIQVPPGHRGATPKLSLQYSSSGGPSPFGRGWDLPIGRIEHTTRWGVPRCDSPHFSEYVLELPGVATELVNDPPLSNTYRPHVEQSYIEATLDPSNNTWTVHDRAGMTYTFGADPNARIGTDSTNFTSTASDGSCLFTSAWALTQIQDPNGNTINIFWRNQLNSLLPLRILYGANVNTQVGDIFYVDFSYETRPDLITSYRHGEKATLYARVTAIQVSSAIDGNILTYSLNYDDDSHPAAKSLLKSVSVSGVNPAQTVYPTQSFTYTPSVTGHSSTPVQFPFSAALRTSTNGSVNTTVMDVNGDGLLDAIYGEANKPWNVILGINSTAGMLMSPFSTIPWQVPTTDGLISKVVTNTSDCPNATEDGVQLASSCTVGDTLDITGDGIADYVDSHCYNNNGNCYWHVYPGGYTTTGGWGFSTAAISWLAPRQYSYKSAGNGFGLQTFQSMQDMNGDGLPDLIVAEGTGGYVAPWQVYMNNGNGFDPTPTPYNTTDALYYLTDAKFMDFNGDGIPDAYRTFIGLTNDDFDYPCEVPHTSTDVPEYYDCLFIYFNTGTGFDAVKMIKISPEIDQTLIKLDQSIGKNDRPVNWDFLDVNGDGLPDRVGPRWHPDTQTFGPDVAVQLNTGGDLEPLQPQSGPLPAGERPYVGTVQGWDYAIRAWSGVSEPLRDQLIQGSDSTTERDMIDVDGDGFLDQMAYGANDLGSGVIEPVWNVSFNRAGAALVDGDAATDPTQPPNTLNMMANGFGGTNAVVYRPSTSYVNTALPFVTWTVAKTAKNDGMCTAAAGTNVYDRTQDSCIAQGHEVVEQFRYQGGFFDAASREFRGFAQVQQIRTEAHVDDNGVPVLTDLDNATVTTFGQDDFNKGLVLETQSYQGAQCLCASPSGASCPNDPEVACSTALTVLQDAANTYTTAAIAGSAGRTQVWLQNTITTTSSAGSGGTMQYLNVVNSPPDAHGNITETTKYDQNGTVLVHAKTDFAVPQSGSHVYDKPSHSVTDDPTHGTLSEQWFYYDAYTNTLGQVGAGNVRHVQSRLDATQPNGPETWTAYDQNAIVTSGPLSQGPVTYGNITQLEDADGHITNTSYDPYSLYPTVVTNALGQHATTAWDYRWGRPISVTDPNNAVTGYSYDAAGRLACVARPGEDLSKCPTEYDYHFAGAAETLSWVKVTEQQDPHHATGCGGAAPKPPLVTQQYFDALGRARQTDTFRIVDSAATTVRSNQTEYDGAGRVANVYFPHDNATTPPATDAERYSYLFPQSSFTDPLGRVQKATHADGAARVTEYLGNETRTTDEEGYITHVIVDPLGRVVRKQADRAGSPYAWTDYAYDGAGRLLTVSQNGSTTPLKRVTYDSLGRKVQLDDGDSGTWRYGYDGVGNLIWQDDPAPNQSEQTCYDPLNRPVRRCPFNDDNPAAHACTSACADTANQVRYFYDGDDGWAVSNSVGRLTRVIDASGQFDVVAYDPRGRQTQTTKTIAVDGVSRHASFTYGYDTNDRVTSIGYPDGEIVSTDYDDSGQPEALRNNSSQFYVISAEYDVLGRLLHVLHGNSVADDRAYGDATNGHRLSALQTSLGETSYLNLTYPQYYARGLLQQETDQLTPSGALTGTATYTYDHMARLTSANSAYSGADHTYTYDALGNMTRTWDENEGVDAYLTYGDTTKPHQVTHIDYGTPPLQLGKDITHDGNGNRTNTIAQSYTYNKEDHLESVTAGGEFVSFFYDSRGQRVAREVGGTGGTVTRYYSSLAETTDSTLTKWYFFGGQRVAMQQVPADVGFETAALSAGSTWLAAVSIEHPALVVVLGRSAASVGGLALLTLGTGLLLAPWRRRPVVGIAVRHGHVVGVALLWTLSTFPWPLAVEPESAAAVATATSTATAMATPTLASLNAAFVAQSVPSAMVAGQSYTVSVTMRNTGATTWTSAAAVRLGSQNPQDNLTWGASNRVGLSTTDAIATGQQKQFTWTVTAPATAGTYNFQWRMLQESVAWFGDFTPNVAVVVTLPTATATATPPSTPTRTPTRSPTATGTVTRTPTATATPSSTPTRTRTGSPTATGTVTRTPSTSPTRTVTRTPSTTPTPTNTATRVPTVTATRTATPPPIVLRHYHLNHLGSTEAVTDGSGKLVEQIRYTPYGTIRGRWDGSNQPIGTDAHYEFTGYETEVDSGLEYAGARFYDPNMGCFLTHDPAAEFVNPYTYVNGDPINATDPTGACPICPFLAVLFLAGAGVGVNAALQSAQRGQSVGQSIEAGILGFVSIASLALPVIGLGATAGSALASEVTAAELVVGAGQTAIGFANHQYVTAGLGAALLAYGAYEALAEAPQGGNGGNGAITPEGAWQTPAEPSFSTPVDGRVLLTLDYYKVPGAFGAAHTDAMLFNDADPTGDSYFVSAGPLVDRTGGSLGRGLDAVAATSGSSSFGTVGVKGWYAPFQAGGGAPLSSTVVEVPLSFEQASSGAESFVKLGNAAAVRYSPLFTNSNSVAFSLPMFLGVARPVPAVWAPGSGSRFP